LGFPLSAAGTPFGLAVGPEDNAIKVIIKERD